MRLGLGSGNEAETTLLLIMMSCETNRGNIIISCYDKTQNHACLPHSQATG